MPLSVGDTLGLYELIAALGAVGMDEMDKASDIFLKREWARKALHAACSPGPDRPACVRREAEPLASLHHPNIGPFYGIVQAERVWALVPALIEGPALAKQLPDTPGTAAHFIRRFLQE